MIVIIAILTLAHLVFASCFFLHKIGLDCWELGILSLSLFFRILSHLNAP